MRRYAVKIRKPGEKRFRFLSDHGATSFLRIRAVTFTEKVFALSWIAANAPLNPDFEFRAVPFDKPEPKPVHVITPPGHDTIAECLGIL